MRVAFQETTVKLPTLFALIIFSTLLAPSVKSQAVDASVCEVLHNPASFDGKLVRLKGTVIAGFEDFAVTDSSCNEPANAIWLDYPEGTKGKAGPAAMLRLSLSKNNPATAPASTRTPVKIEKNKDFKDFDSLLSTPCKMSAVCLGCPRYEVTATLVGRLDGTGNAGVQRDASGKVIGVGGVGNLNQYRARLVLQSVSEVVPKEIDYTNASTATKGDAARDAAGDPVAAAHAAARALGGGGAADQVERAAAAYGKEGDDNGVRIGFGVANEEIPNDRKSGGNSPDGLILDVTFNYQLKGDAMSRAIAHFGTHIADIRTVTTAPPSLFDLETRAWFVTVLSAIGAQQKTMTLPGGYLIWNAAWSGNDRTQLSNQATTDYLTHWAALKNAATK
jgi:hypothetical protein